MSTIQFAAAEDAAELIRELKGEGFTASLRQVFASGEALPAEIAASVLRAPVSSRGGLGIGLYQAARQAEASGYRLALESNRDGEVCFALTGTT